MKPSLEAITALGFGAMIGAGLAGAAYVFMPAVRVVTWEQALIAGTLLGGGLHRLLNSVLMFVLGPAGRLLRLASELSLVVILARSGLIATADRYDYIRGSVDKFLDRPAIGQPKKLGS